MSTIAHKRRTLKAVAMFLRDNRGKITVRVVSV